VTRLSLPSLPALFVRRGAFRGSVGVELEEAQLLERGIALRSMVRSVRDAGWTKCLVIEGFAPDISIVLIPRDVMAANVMAADTFRVREPLPRDLAEYVVGTRRAFPDASLQGVEVPERREFTISWRPKAATPTA